MPAGRQGWPILDRNPKPILLLLSDPSRRIPVPRFLLSRFCEGEMYLLMAIVNDETDPPTLVTVDRTGKVSKYWREP